MMEAQKRQKIVHGGRKNDNEKTKQTPRIITIPKLKLQSLSGFGDTWFLKGKRRQQLCKYVEVSLRMFGLAGIVNSERDRVNTPKMQTSQIYFAQPSRHTQSTHTNISLTHKIWSGRKVQAADRIFSSHNLDQVPCGRMCNSFRDILFGIKVRLCFAV